MHTCIIHTYIHTYTYIYIYIHTYIYKHITKTTGCGTSHKYTNIHNITVHNTMNILQNSTIGHLYTHKIHLQSQGIVYFIIFLRLL